VLFAPSWDLWGTETAGFRTLSPPAKSGIRKGAEVLLSFAQSSADLKKGEPDMEQWRIHKLIERDTESGSTRPLGGGITALKIFSAIGQLDQIDIIPVDAEQVQRDCWFNQYVRLQLADRLVWLDPEETRLLIELLGTALTAAEENVRNALE